MQVWGPFRISKDADRSMSCWVPVSAGHPFRVCMGAAGSVFCGVPVPTGLFMDCAGKGWSPVTGPFQHLQSDLVWWAYLKGLTDHSQDRLELNHRPLKEPKPGLRSAPIA